MPYHATAKADASYGIGYGVGKVVFGTPILTPELPGEDSGARMTLCH